MKKNEYINDTKKYYTQFNGGRIENYFENEILNLQFDYDNGELFVAKMENNGKEYILNFGRQAKLTEFYDLENNWIYYKQTIIIFFSLPLQHI